ncbi:lysophospholipid acyltransferase family protein [Georgenia sp. Z1491]|uniref:lysophospholipid acyltransferase family protein n=1 Tax=Georgenia sp. Z1491 TaxID=3416707 RepID=UPI003CE747FF
MSAAPMHRADDGDAAAPAPTTRQHAHQAALAARKAASRLVDAAGESLLQYTSGFWRAGRVVAQKGPLNALLHTVTRIDVVGRENLQGVRGPFVVAPNHSSHLDAAVIHATMPWQHAGRVATAAAGDTFYTRRLTRVLTALFFNTYPVDRSGNRRKAGLSARLVDAGVPLLIFPEGTRSRTGEMARFKPGVAALCVTRRIPCIPVALIGFHEAMPVGQSFVSRGRPHLKVVIGRPLRPRRGERIREFNERIQAQVAAMYRARTPDVVVARGTGTVGRRNGQEEAS